MKSNTDIKTGLRQRSPAFLYRWLSVAALLLISLLPANMTALGDPPVFFQKKDITLQKISPRELENSVDGSLAIDEGGIDLRLGSDGSPLNDYEIPLGDSYTATTIRRRIEELWEWKILKNKNEDKPYIKAEYSVTGANGQRGVLSNTSDPSDIINVKIEPIALSWKEKNNQWICSGNIELILDIADISRSGTFEGTINTLISIASF